MKCNLCPNECNVDREKFIGRCLSGNNFKIAKYAPFFYEEPPVSGKFGSGAIFFCGCSLKCRFCQNYPLSRNEQGIEVSDEKLIEIIKELEGEKVHNVNLVNPTHYADKLYNVFSVYKPSVPVVYNTHGYEKTETLEKVNSFVDVYLTDLKYYSPKRSLRYTGIKDYFEKASVAIKKMVKDKPLIIENGIIKQGVIVRHLILPQNTDESISLIKFYAENIGDNAYLSLMTQYTPYGDLEGLEELKRTLSAREIKKVTDFVFSLDLKNVFLQEKSSSDERFIPKWDY